MPKKLVKKLLSFIPGKPAVTAKKRYTLKVIPRDQHCISRKDISEPAKKVLNRLNNAGYDAYLVGGGVRDLLLGQHPKDFDIATNATPEEVNQLFRNSRLIGRRFRIVHVLFGREVIEVTTFRGGQVEQEETDTERAVNEHGHLVRDNVYGSKEEDALRRDFTVNALYYCIRDFTVHDYADGVRDLEARQLRLIGDPETRYREDPVRMLRAIRFAAKLDFAIAEESAAPIPELAGLLEHIPPARLFEEILKLFGAGYGEKTYVQMQHYGLFGALFPTTQAALDQGEEDDIIRQALRNTDERIHQGKSVTPYFLFAALLWPALKREWQRLEDNGEATYPALQLAAHRVIDRQVRSIAIPRRFSVPMKEIWEMQPRLTRRQGKRAEMLVEHPRFRAAYDFLLVREAAGEHTEGLGEWWTQYQQQNDGERRKMTSQVANDGQRRRRRRRKPRVDQ
ncbi:polynucleotide adenylyltransferase PcnB [Mangrovitalea sediminis]|uniref:polynucleotide adenylyltransferase PcnB n=1 Tax=Mangrovitalea sediminis TaxID=1982043 RepID=UPI000BE4E9C7|nr:polynucleotide adenylyltransferase PcnB [Mangrovitalea sediminis]